MYRAAFVRGVVGFLYARNGLTLSEVQKVVVVFIRNIWCSYCSDGKTLLHSGVSFCILI